VRTCVCVAATVVAAMMLCGAGPALADGSGDPASAKQEGGKYFDKDGTPTYHVGGDGKVDWPSYSGFRRYHSDCHVCHGPDGEGSSYAPSLVQSVKAITYGDFLGAVASGKKNVNTASENVMPAFGTNPNVMCYLDDIFVYLRGRANGAIPRGRPEKREDKSKEIEAAENSCLGK